MLDFHCIVTGTRVDASRTRLVLLIVGGQDRADEGGGENRRENCGYAN